MPPKTNLTVKIQATRVKLLGKSKRLSFSRLDFHTYCTGTHAWIFTLKLNIPLPTALSAERIEQLLSKLIVLGRALAEQEILAQDL